MCGSWPIAEWLLRAIEMEKRAFSRRVGDARSANRLFFLEVRGGIQVANRSSKQFAGGSDYGRQ
jgi:hypothetical protein